MPIIKTPCPKCEANMRFTVESEGDHEVACLKCGHEFVATLEPDEPPAKAKKAKPGTGTSEKVSANGAVAKPGKAAKKARRTNDDEDDAPKKKKKKGDAEDDGQRKKLLLVGGIGGAILLVVLGLGIYAATSGGDKNKTVTKPADPAPEVKPQPVVPVGGGTPGTGTPGTGTPGTGTPGTGKPPVTTPPVTTPPKKEEEAEAVELATELPPKPKLRPSTGGGSLVSSTKPVATRPAIPPLAPDEDPFVRASKFTPDGPLPPVPPLPKITGRPLLTLDSGGHTGMVGKVFFNFKGDRIITVGEDKAVRFWDPVANETVKTIRFPAGPGKEGSLQAAAMSRNGKRLAVAGTPLAAVANGKVPIYVISPDTGNQIALITQGSSAVTSLHFSNDGNRIAVGCDDGTAQLFTVPGGQQIGRVDAHRGGIQEVRYNPNLKSNILATLGYDSKVKVFNLTQQTNIAFGVVGVIPSCLAWSNDGQHLALGTTTGEIMIGTADGKLLRTLPAQSPNGKPLKLFQIQFMPNDRELAVVGVGNGGWAGIVSADSGNPRVAVTSHSNSVFAVDVSVDGEKIVSSGGNQHETLVWKADDGTIQHRLVGTGAGVWAVAWSKDGKSIAWGNSNKREEGVLPLEGTFRLDEFGVGDPPDPSKYTQTVDGDESGVRLTTDSKTFKVKTAGRDETVVYLPDREPIYSATVLPKGNAILVGGVESLYMINPATIGIMQKFVGHTGHVLSVTPSPDSRYFATGSSDQTIRIWQRNREEPVLSIFVAGREWIAWTPQGFYACSPQGERLIAWQINAGAVKFPTIHPAARFRESMYKPAMLKYLIPTGDLSKAMAMALKFDKELVKTTSVADVLPPEVTLDGFTDAEMKVDKDTLTIKARATSPKHPITAMRLLVNGRPFNGTTGVKRFTDGLLAVEATWEIPLVPGTHTVSVIADSPVSKGMSKVGIVFRPGDPPKPNLYVLTVGIADYPGKLKLNYCATDAEMLATAFQEKSKGVFNKIEVKVLTDKQATKKNILAGMDWLKSRMTAQDVGIVSFSGHGMRDDFGRFYMVPYDYDPKDTDGLTGLSGDEFKSRLDNMPGRLVAILDTCHAGVVAEKDRPPARADNLVRDLTAEDSGVIVMCASLGREYAIESKLCKAGFYTLGLVEGLEGHADIDGDGFVYLNELDQYATARVRQLSGGKQNPTLGRPSAIKSFPIAKPDKPVAP